MNSCSEMRTEGPSWLHLLACPTRLRHLYGHHASSNQRITKNSGQRLDRNMIQRARDKYLAFESSQASSDAHQHQFSLITCHFGSHSHNFMANFPVKPDFTECFLSYDIWLMSYILCLMSLLCLISYVLYLMSYLILYLMSSVYDSYLSYVFMSYILYKLAYTFISCARAWTCDVGL